MGLAGQLPHEKGQEPCSQPLSPKREDGFSLHPSAIKEDCKKHNRFSSQCLMEISPQSAPSSICTWP